MNNNKRYLFLGSHLDDIEFGCGALISKLIAQGCFVHFFVLSEMNMNSQGDIQLRRDVSEAFSSMGRLGVPRDRISIGKCHGQVFDQEEQIIREELLHIRKVIDPTAVYFPSQKDVHQDHSALARNAFRIFRNVDCFGYEVIRSSFEFFPNYYEAVSEADVKRKADAIMTYHSQLTQSAGYYFDEKVIASSAIFRGAQVGLKYAEAFECYRIIVCEEV